MKVTTAAHIPANTAPEAPTTVNRTMRVWLCISMRRLPMDSRISARRDSWPSSRAVSLRDICSMMPSRRLMRSRVGGSWSG